MPRNTTPKLVTRDTLRAMLSDPRFAYVEAVVGHALVALLERQTREEAAVNTTNLHNTIGFSGADAYSGSLTAKSYIKNRRLAPGQRLKDWQVARWTKPARNGYPRLCKYARQLNEIALAKQAS